MDLFDLDWQRASGSPIGLAWGFQQARILQVGVRLGLFAALAEEARSVAWLAQTLTCDQEMLERLLIALSTMGLTLHDEGQWRNSMAARLYLLPERPMFLGESIEQAAELWDVYTHLERIVRDGLTDERRQWLLARVASGEAKHFKALHALAVAGQAQRLARLASAMGGRRTLLDVGGAPGTYSLALCQRFPALHATLLDSAEGCTAARALLAEAQGGERVAFQEGAWQSDKFGNGTWEALLLGQVLAGSESHVLKLLMRAYEALRPGGLLLLHTFLLDNDLNGPSGAALLHLLHGTLTLDTMRAVMAEAGFEQIALLHRAADAPDILIAYKPLDTLDEPDPFLTEYISPEQELFAMMGLGEDDSDGLTIQRRVWERLVQSN